jgi:hypothetical protein
MVGLKKGPIFGVGAAAVATLAVFGSGIHEAEACSGSPPPPQCGIALTCSTAVNDSFVTSLTSSINGNVEAGLVLQITGSDPRCPNATGEARIDYEVRCFDFDLALRDPNSTDQWRLAGSGTVNAQVRAGLNHLTVPVRIAPGHTRQCEVTGRVGVVLSTGQRASTTCGEQDLCLGPKADQMSAAAVEMELVSERPIFRAGPGEPKLLTYRIRNNTTHDFFGNLTASSQNPTRPIELSDVPPPNPNPDEVCPASPGEPLEEPLNCADVPKAVECGCDGQSYYNSCLRENYGVAKLHDGACKPPPLSAAPFAISDPGSGNVDDAIGDSFPLVWADETADYCIPLPENPALTTDMQIERFVEVGPGQTIEVGLIKRSWGLCADGSCAQTRVVLNGGVRNASGYEIVVACGGSAVVIEERTPVNGQPREPAHNCPDTGITPGVMVWTDPLIQTEVAWDLPHTDSSGNHVPDWVERLFDFDPNGSGDEFTQTFGISAEELVRQGVTTNLDLVVQFGTGEPVFEVPFDVSKPFATSNFSRPLTIYDAEGNAIEATIFFQRTADGTWQYFVVVDGGHIAGGQAGVPMVILDGVLEFGPNGSLVSHTPGQSSFTPVNGGSPQPIVIEFTGSRTHADATVVQTFDLNPGPMDILWGHLEDQDSSGNGIPDIVQVMFGFSHHDPMDGQDLSRYSTETLQIMDDDGDGLTDYDEIYLHRTIPINPDTDADGVTDGNEVLLYSTSPLHPDTDRGGLSDGREIAIGLDPLNSHDDRMAAGPALSSSPVAGVVFVGSEANLSTVMRKNRSTFGTTSPMVRAQARELSSQTARIEEYASFGTSFNADSTLEISVPFDAFPLLGESPYQVNRVEIGKKPQHPGHLGRDLTGAGYLRLSSSPYTIFEFLYQLSVWGVRTSTGQSERLRIEEFFFTANDRGYTLEVTVKMPAYAVDELILLHDFNAHEKRAFLEVCNDGVDNTGNGFSDCEDPYCANDPVCRGVNDPSDPQTPGDDDPNNPSGPSVPGGNNPDQSDEVGTPPGRGSLAPPNGGCGCYSTGGGVPPADFLLTVFGLGAVVVSRRWRRNRLASARAQGDGEA